MLKFKLKKDDPVIVISGKSKGQKGKIKQVLRDKSAVLVEGVNLSIKHKKPSQADTGGISKQEAPVHISNVAYFDEASKKASRIGYKVEKGKKSRFLKTSGKVID